MKIVYYKKSARKPMVFRPWDEWRHELSIYILLKTLHFSKICAMIYIQENPFPSPQKGEKLYVSYYKTTG